MGADVLVWGASRLALSLGISPLAVGLTVVAFGTSAPEVAVSVAVALACVPIFMTGQVIARGEGVVFWAITQPM